MHVSESGGRNNGLNFERDKLRGLEFFFLCIHLTIGEVFSFT